MSAGGTGGHLFPAQAVAESLKEYEILFVAGGLQSSRFFDRVQFPYKEISSATFSLAKPHKLLRSASRIVKGSFQSHQIIRSFSPDLVVGFGSFYTLPLLLAAKMHRIPIILHEQNAHAGRVNRLFSRFAHTTAVTFPVDLKGNLQQVRFPLRSQKKEDPWHYFGLERGEPVLLVYGGSQGALRLNELFLEAITHLSGYQVLHFTGDHFTGEKCESIQRFYEKLGIRHCVKPFEPNIHLALEIADLAICRAGAGTIADLIEKERPAILIPFPHATADHQRKNGLHFVGGEVYVERELTAERLAKAISNFPLLEKKQAIQNYKKNNDLIDLSDLIRDIINHG